MRRCSQSSQPWRRADREIEIIQALVDKILVFEEAMGHACDVCAELDCLLCFAETSNAYGYARPEMCEENITNIKQGRSVFSSLLICMALC